VHWHSLKTYRRDSPARRVGPGAPNSPPAAVHGRVEIGDGQSASFHAHEIADAASDQQRQHATDVVVVHLEHRLDDFARYIGILRLEDDGHESLAHVFGSKLDATRRLVAVFFVVDGDA